MSKLHDAVRAHYVRAALCLACWLTLLLGGSAWIGQRWRFAIADVPAAWQVAWVLMAWLIAVNLCTWQFWQSDKRIARRAASVRVPEALLLLLSLAGGLPAAVMAMRVLRHKSAKPSFQWRLAGVGVLWATVLGGVGWWVLAG